jgi:uncharacterized protein
LFRRKGDLLYNENIHPCATNRNYYGDEKIKSMVNAYKIDAISIGNGTSRETGFFIKKIALINQCKYL